MALPPRVYFTLHEASVRWECSLADIAGWASVGRFNIVTAIGGFPNGLQPLSGFGAVLVTDILQMFRRCGTGPTTCRLWRVRPLGQEEYVSLSEHSSGIEVTLADLLIMAEDVRRFEADFDLLRRPASHIGSTARYDWDEMYISLIRRVHEHGVPETQAEWVGEVQEWFVKKSDSGEVPDERTIRRKLTPIWKSLRETC
ncbi:hypothetical protein [Roseovarius sp. M141]|uniref:hypothetical protein n=1 Tax=Roseovarius sp. M141 TaxID=2583806 RepID=UPI0020CD02E4|nr:hypothetical protein [Roseovarius sp. M141]MCQ0090921.1 hypothetical protein [Roseovarius sp. M141]MCQ0094244.1 hypothetical protein [Roseovarius sp. M141]